MKRALLAAAIFAACDPQSGAEFRSWQQDVEFDPAQLQTPESVAVDRAENLYVSLALTGEIHKVDPDGNRSAFAQIPIGTPLQPCHGFIAVLHAITVDRDGNVYAAAAACDLDHRGVWKVTPQGDAQVLATVDAAVQLNGIAWRKGVVYATDSNAGQIFKVSDQGGPASVWVTSALLDPVPNEFGAPGANGIQFLKKTAVVANSSTAQLVSIDLGPHDNPGTPHLLHQLDVGCDDFAFDVHGSIYCTTNPFQTVVRVDTDGSQTTIFTAADGLDGPTATTFGRKSDNDVLYIANASFPFFPSTGNGPSVIAKQLDVVGWPLR